jgi:Gram-negative bacterial TonB protein C-terminal
VNLGLLSQSEAPSSTASAWDSQDTGAHLLELRTPSGAVYVRPSRWQRIRLQWAFRHFHELPLQVLSRRDQRLIEKLFQSAVVTPASPVAGITLLGVVENVHSKPPATPARVVTMQPQAAPAKPFRPVPWTPAVLSPDFSQRKKEKDIKQMFGTAKSRDVRDVPFRQWGALGALAAVCVTVIVASFYGILPLRPLVQRTAAVKHAPTLPAPTLPAPAQASNNIKPPAAMAPAHAAPPTPATTLAPKHPAAPSLTEPAPPHNELASLENGIDRPTIVTNARTPVVPSVTPIPETSIERVPITPASSSVPLLVSELPQGHFAHPVVSEPNLVGELQLKALIGADGLVKQVTVMSGNPKLAEVGMRAVRQWHYAPYQVLGSPVEVETQIKMSFFGEDAVSVASVASGPPPSSRVASVPSPHDRPLSSKPD